MLKRGVVLIACWTGFAVLWSASVAAEGARGFFDALETMLPFYWGWAALTPPIIWWTRRVHAQIGEGPRAWLALAAGAPVVVVAHGAAYLTLVRLLGIRRTAVNPDAFVTYVSHHAAGDVATYAALVGILLFLAMERRTRERELLAATLQTRLARTDLELLRWQLQPHFLFNALNTVSTLVLKSDVRRADQAVHLIAHYLRSALTPHAETTATLADELEDVARYVAIEALRFGGDLELELRVAEETRAVRLPRAVLQPLVENAVRHGVSAAGGRGPIVIAAARQGARVRVTVADPGSGRSANDGPAAPPAAAPRERGADGFGLRYVRERLRHLYGDDARVELRVSPTGSIAALDLPWSEPQ